MPKSKLHFVTRRGLYTVSLDFWRDVAVIWLCIQGFFMLLIPLAIAFFMVRGINWVVAKTPPIFHKAQGYSRLMRNKTDLYAGKVADPLIRAHGAAQKTQTVLSQIVESEDDPASRSSSQRLPNR
jgi:hypothetical protein